MHGFPIISRHHLDCVPGTTIEERAVWSFAYAFLTADAEIRIDFDTAEWRMIFVRHPKHAGFDRTVFDAGWGACAPRAAIGGDRKNSRSLLARRLAVAL
jgi:hypothetical protein